MNFLKDFFKTLLYWWLLLLALAVFIGAGWVLYNLPNMRC